MAELFAVVEVHRKSGHRYGSSFRRPRSTATPPSRSVKPLPADPGSTSGAFAAGDVQTPGFVLLPVDPQLKDCGGWNEGEKNAVQLVEIVAESPPTPAMSELVNVSLQPPGPPTKPVSDIDHPSIAPLPLVEKAMVPMNSRPVLPVSIVISVGVTEKSLRLSPSGALSVTKPLNVPTGRIGGTLILVEPARGFKSIPPPRAAPR